MASKRWSLWLQSGSLELDTVRLSSFGKGRQLPETMLYLLLTEYLQTSYLAFLNLGLLICKVRKIKRIPSSKMRLKGEITWSPFGRQRALNRPLLAVVGF